MLPSNRRCCALSKRGTADKYRRGSFFKTSSRIVEYFRQVPSRDILQATRPGDKLLLRKDPRQNCTRCSSETGGLGAAATDLLEMVDLVKGKGESEGSLFPGARVGRSWTPLAPVHGSSLSVS